MIRTMRATINPLQANRPLFHYVIGISGILIYNRNLTLQTFLSITRDFFCLHSTFARLCNARLTETCSLGLPCTFLIYDIMLWSIDICQIKLSADQYHVTISRAQVYSSPRSRVLLKLTADQVLVFDWIAGLCQVNLLKHSRVVRKPVNSNPGLKVNQIITDSPLQMFLVYSFCFVYQFCDY